MQEKVYPRIHEKVITETLANGLKIVIVPKPGFTKAYAQLSVHYGSIDAAFDAGKGIVVPPKGVAHFLEHKVFEQPDGGNALTTFAQTGASPNAFTSKNMTAYHFSCTENFERNLEILLDFVSSPHFTEENVSKEQGIIGQEIGMVNDKPDFKVYENLMANLFKVHPARDSIIGTVESIGNIDRNVLYDCYRTFYIPSNMLLTVVGDVDAKKIIETAEAMLDKKYTTPPKRDYGVEPCDVACAEICQTMECNLPIFALGFKKLAETSGDEGAANRACASMACELLFGEGSAFYSELYGKGIINQEFGAEAIFYPGCIAIVLSGESRNPELVKEAVLKVSHNIDDEYFERIKRAIYGMKIRRSDRFASLCRSIAEAEFANFDYFDTFNIFEKITKRDIMKFVESFPWEKSMTMSKVLPKNEEV
ncbi:MAG: insulinase family protein [Clostridia bacterium]|nr:insulinase family protein [Clostridia bacterium]